MPVVDVKNLDGKTVGKVELPDGVFAVKVNPHVLHETSRWYLNSQRAGTHKTKGRAEVQGSGRKLWRQKGTGRARIGSIRSPLWRKGGTVHGPQPRSYAYRLPRKVFLGALRSALSSKLAEEKLIVVDAWQLDSHKTKPFRKALDKLGSESPTILLVETAENHNLELASRNLDGVKLSLSHDLQPYDLLRHDRLMLSKDAAVRLGTVLGPKDGSAAAAPDEKEAAKPAAAAEKPAAKKAAKPRAEKAAAKPKAAKKPAAAKSPKGKGKGKE
ncbi:MAG TPA: 50S ribosomal protein L4 [Candidatus Acidoferrales bacterium]|jgi:large subunit ribosomal protein L4|nr:50S ribosomal protein L4 [Candidatus Acidoferrales bacterium]